MRRVLRIALCALLVGCFLPTSAFAETEAELRARLDALKKRAASAGEDYSEAYWDLDESEVRLARIDKRLKVTRGELSEARSVLNARAAAMYRREDSQLVEFLLGASDFPSFVTRFDHLSRIGRADAEAVIRVTDLRSKLRAERTRLREERDRRRRSLEDLRRRRDKLQRQLRATEREFLEVKRRLDSVRSAGRPRPAGVASAPGPNGMVFPVVGSYFYSNTWGASRSGGRRRHQGTDIMAPRGTRIVAITSGTVRAGSNRLGGKTIWLSGTGGWQFYYAHLDTILVRSGRVRAGEVIGTVGSTGNASASSPHLHLQMHPGGGAPVNPYPYLRRME